jgi:hypothetical protein
MKTALIDLIGSPNWRSRVYAQLSRMKGATKDRTLQGDIDLLFSVLFVVSADEFRIQLATFNSRQAEQSRASA